MGLFINPGNIGFQTVRNGKYIDKSGLIALVNASLCTVNKLTLWATVKLAYFAYLDAYIQMEELPGGKGYADIVYFPKAGIGYPALLIELKADGTDADGAIGQIKANNYPAALKAYDVPILLVGISYDKKTRKHSCRIELHGDTD